MTARAKVKRTNATVFVLIASAAFATSSPLGRWARPADPTFVACARVFFASIVLFAAGPRAVLDALRAVSSRRRAGIAGAGAILGAHFALFLVGLDRTSLPAAIALVSLEPLSVVLCAWLIHRVRPTRLELLGVGVATAGAVVVASGAGHGEHHLVGDLFVVGAVILYGFYVAAARGLRGTLDARSYATIVYVAAAIALAIFLTCVPGAWSATLSLPAHSWIAILALAAIPTIIGHTLVQASARDLSPAIVALVSPGETIGGIAIAALIGRYPSTREILGTPVVLAGATIAILGGKPGAEGAE